MPHYIEILGAMYEANVIEVDDDDVARLLKSLEDELTPWEGNEEIEDEIMGDSIINGFLFNGDVPQFTVEIDGVSHPELFHQAISEDESKPAEAVTETLKEKSKGWPNGDFEIPESFVPRTKAKKPHSLVYERWSRRGSVYLESDDPIELKDFELHHDEVTLPNGKVSSVISPCYEHEGFEWGDSWTDAVELYIVKSDGEVIQLESDGD